MAVNEHLRKIARRGISRVKFRGSADYWERRYAEGQTSGDGSYGQLAEFKAEFLNTFVADHDIKTVLEIGCGDGAQLERMDYPSYQGFDVSPTVVTMCQERYAEDPTKTFALAAEGLKRALPVDLTLSLDVIYHLVEDQVFEAYMADLFRLADRFVIVYASNENRPRKAMHVRHRKFTDWVATNAPGWKWTKIENPLHADIGTESAGSSFADFYVFER